MRRLLKDVDDGTRAATEKREIAVDVKPSQHGAIALPFQGGW